MPLLCHKIKETLLLSQTNKQTHHVVTGVEEPKFRMFLDEGGHDCLGVGRPDGDVVHVVLATQEAHHGVGAGEHILQVAQETVPPDRHDWAKNITSERCLLLRVSNETYINFDI